MARLPYLDDATMAGLPIGDHAKSINLYRILGHSPGLAEAFNGLGRYIRWDSKCDPRLRELAILQVGYLARSPYEWSHHIKIAQKNFGVTDADIEGVIAETQSQPSALGEDAKLVCRAAREMTQDHRMRDETYDALAAMMPKDALMDLIATIGFYNCVVRVLATTDMDVEPDYQPMLDKFPLPTG